MTILNDVDKYWKKVRALAPKEPHFCTADCDHLPEAVWIMSLENEEKQSTGGQVMAADRYTAAVRIVEGTHKLASDAEAANHNKLMKFRAETIAAEEKARVLKYQIVNTFSIPETMMLVAKEPIELKEEPTSKKGK